MQNGKGISTFRTEEVSEKTLRAYEHALSHITGLEITKFCYIPGEAEDILSMIDSDGDKHELLVPKTGPGYIHTIYEKGKSPVEIMRAVNLD